MEPDIVKLDFLHLMPMDLIPRNKLPSGYKEYSEQEKMYWKVG